MRLIGMLDSPYVRRVAISMELLGLVFTQESVSVFSTFEKFKAINPIVKAPSLVCDDGEILMDSSLILQFLEFTKANGKSLWSKIPDVLQHQFRAVSVALAACEKSVQIVYERNLRPVSAQYEPWIERVTAQLLTAYELLEHEVQTQPALFAGNNQASVTAAVVWQFTQSMLGVIVPGSDHPGLASLSQRLEQTPAFLKYPPNGPGV
jgi:glutathione S-transferase